MADNFNTKDPSEKLPVRTLSIQIEENQREELFSQLRKLTEKHHLEFYLDFYKDKEIFSVGMYGHTLHISALSNSINTTELDIHFCEEDPANPPSPETVDVLYNDLKAFISEIPNVTIAGEK